MIFILVYGGVWFCANLSQNSFKMGGILLIPNHASIYIYLSTFLIIPCIYVFENSNFQCYFRMDDVILTYAFGFLNNQNTMMRDKVMSWNN